jgi:hypothetical protein
MSIADEPVGEWKRRRQAIENGSAYPVEDDYRDPSREKLDNYRYPWDFADQHQPRHESVVKRLRQIGCHSLDSNPGEGKALYENVVDAANVFNVCLLSIVSGS